MKCGEAFAKIITRSKQSNDDKFISLSIGALVEMTDDCDVLVSHSGYDGGSLYPRNVNNEWSITVDPGQVCYFLTRIFMVL